jgi:hypothetical protein
MEIQISEKFSRIEVINPDSQIVKIQCALWPSWGELVEATKELLNQFQLSQLEDLFRSESHLRDFKIEDQILKIRLVESKSI